MLEGRTTTEGTNKLVEFQALHGCCHGCCCGTQGLVDQSTDIFRLRLSGAADGRPSLGLFACWWHAGLRPEIFVPCKSSAELVCYSWRARASSHKLPNTVG